MAIAVSEPTAAPVAFKTYTVEDQLALMLKLMLEKSIPSLVQSWQNNLDMNELDEEMFRVFVALGWITPRDPRVHKIK
jgi:hypothetical protein